jgi:hypothetical protein
MAVNCEFLDIKSRLDWDEPTVADFEANVLPIESCRWWGKHGGEWRYGGSAGPAGYMAFILALVTQ